MYEPMRELAYELLAGLIHVPGLRQIKFGDACQSDELSLLINEIPHWPEILVEFLTVFNGVTFYPEHGCFFSITEIIEKFRYLQNQDQIPADVLPSFFGTSSSGSLLALDSSKGQLPGQESILAIPENHILKGLCFHPDESPSPRFLSEKYVIGTGFETWMDSWITELRQRADLGLLGGFTSNFSVKKS